MIKQKASREAVETMWETFRTVQETVVEEYLSGDHPCQPWKLVPAQKLKQIWSSFTATGFIRDEKGLLYVQETIIENLCRLEVNNIVSGHTELEARSVLEDYFGEESLLVEEHQESFCDWAIDLPDGGWRISDYGSSKMFPLAELAIGAVTSEERLVYLDMALNIIHQRSDLAGWFIEGGSKTLFSISGEGIN